MNMDELYIFWVVSGMHLLHHIAAFTCSSSIIVDDSIVRFSISFACKTVALRLPSTHRLSVFLFSAGDFACFWKNAKLVLEFPMSVLYETYFSMIRVINSL